MKRVISFAIDFGLGTVLLINLIDISLRFLAERIELTSISNLQFSLGVGILGHLIFFSLSSLPAALFGKTLGQKVAGIRIVRDTDLSRISVTQSIVLYLSFVLLNPLTGGVGILIILFRKDGKGLHNILSKTKIIEIERNYNR